MEDDTSKNMQILLHLQFCEKKAIQEQKALED